MPEMNGSLDQCRSKESGEEMDVRDISEIKQITDTQQDVQGYSEESKRWM